MQPLLRCSALWTTLVMLVPPYAALSVYTNQIDTFITYTFCAIHETGNVHSATLGSIGIQRLD